MLARTLKQINNKRKPAEIFKNNLSIGLVELSTFSQNNRDLVVFNVAFAASDLYNFILFIQSPQTFRMFLSFKMKIIKFADDE